MNEPPSKDDYGRLLQSIAGSRSGTCSSGRPVFIVYSIRHGSWPEESVCCSEADALEDSVGHILVPIDSSYKDFCELWESGHLRWIHGQ